MTSFDLSTYYDHCPKWCVDSVARENPHGLRTSPSDDHLPDHSSGTYGVAGARLFLNLERPDLNGLPTGQGLTREAIDVICLSNGEDDPATRAELHMSPAEARSLARILVHLADLDEL